MEPLFIGPYELGATQNLKPFMIPETAFPTLLNEFPWRGRIEKKAGYQSLGRLQRRYNNFALGNISSADPSIDIKTLTGYTGTNAVLAPGFIITLDAPDSQTLTDVGTGSLVIAPADANKITAATVDYLTGVVTLQWGNVVAASVTTFTGGYFPALPVMGIRTQEITGTINNDKTIFFDTTYAYRNNGATFEELQSALPTTWSGTDAQQFWSTNFQMNAYNVNQFWVTNDVPGIQGYTISAATKANPMDITTVDLAPQIVATDVIYLFNMDQPEFNFVTANVTGVVGNVITTDFDSSAFAAAATSGVILVQNHNISGDGIRIYVENSAVGATWSNLNPLIDGVTALAGCLMLIPYKGRMVALSTWEGSTTATAVNFTNRARWSQNGDATDVVNGWRSDIPGRGGFADAATDEEMISCGFVKDNLIVYFERSTWQLVYTGNEIQPFVWQRINAELGAESTFSAVQFDNGLICLGNVGIHTCNGVQVKRIDQAIPNEIFEIHNGSDGPQRSSGIRDFFQEVVYFAYPREDDNTTTSGGSAKVFYPNKMIIYNYSNNTFAFTTDNATCFGIFQRINGKPWASLIAPFTWAGWSDPWDTGVVQQQFGAVAFGNQQGFVQLIVPTQANTAPTLYVTDVVGTLITSIQHNLFMGDFVRFTTCNGISNIDDTIFEVTAPITSDTFTIVPIGSPPVPPSGTYTGNGYIQVMSPCNIESKQFTPFWTKGKCYNLKYVDLLFDKTGAGEVSIDIYVDFNTTDSMSQSSSRLGSPVVATKPEGTDLPYYSFQKQQTQIWKRFYADATGETFQIAIRLSPDQLRDFDIAESDIVLHAMILYFDEAGVFY